jgi:hypothetical protein
MTKVDSQINLVVLGNIEDVFFVLHVHRHKLVANFRSVLSIVYRAEKLSFDVLFQLKVAFKFDAFTLDLLAPAILIKAFSEKNHVGQYDPIVIFIDPIRHSI